MKSERWQRLEQLFDACMELAPDEREAHLARECPDDPGLRRQVASLVASSGPADSFIQGAIGEAVVSATAGSEPQLQRLGPYGIVRPLGQGGMGAVYLAVRDDQEYRKQVAIKVMRAGLEAPELRRRFLAERQILASLDHPGIARLLDGGTTDDAIPYVVMEYIDGKPLDEYCDAERLSVVERLRIFRRVCAGVEFAHRNLVVHRDIKPGNILVADDGTPKLLDFGIAKLLEPEMLSGSAIETGTATRLLTPEYASPEQIRGDPITTASDVYSLGVLLYEILTGHRPYRLEKRRPGDMERVICEEDPDAPSTAVSQNFAAVTPPGDDAPRTPDAIATARRTQPERLRRLLRGDLDNIVLMAMRKEPSRRYGSVGALADDIKRYLEGRPVVARKATWSYRSAKFVRRHAVGVAVAATFAAVIMGSGANMVVQAQRLARERDRAESEREKAERSLAFMVDLFKVSDPSEARGNDITAREILDRGAENIAAGLEDQPEMRATLQMTIGSVYHGLGLLPQARPLLEEVLETRRAMLDGQHPDLADALAALALVEMDAGEYDSAAAKLSEAVDIREAALGPDDPGVALALTSLGSTLSRAGRFADALPLLERALAIHEKAYGPEDKEVGRALNNLAVLLRRLGDNDAARPLYERALAINEKELGPDHPDTARSLNNLATVLTVTGKHREARPHYERALAITERVAGPEHPSLVTMLSNMAFGLKEDRDYDAARLHYERALGIAGKVFESGHPEIGLTLTDLGNVIRLQGNPEQGLEQMARGIEILEASLGPDHPYMLPVMETFACTRAEAGDFAGARTTLEEMLAAGEERWGPEDARLGKPLAYRGMLLRFAADLPQAEENLQRAVPLLEKAAGPAHPNTAWARLQLAMVYASRNDHHQRAEALYRQAAAVLQAEGGLPSPDLKCSLSCYWAVTGDQQQALELLARAPAGAGERRWLRLDPDLAELQAAPTFQAAAGPD